METKIWKEEIEIPTYGVGKPEKNPMFLEKRVYQGSSGIVYPYQVIEKVYDDKQNKKYQALFLENEFLKIMILPELGGRVHMAYDKIKNRHFIYYNEVIKPALVGLTGPWISGGIEFNWPQHHRPNTFGPVDFLLEEKNDGSKIIWVNEIERMSRLKVSTGFTVYPGKAYLEIKVKLYNPMPYAQTFLWWANPAVHVNDFYQSVFPPDVHAVFDHGKRDVSKFPIATGTYYKVDYSDGVDISWFKNIPVPTSYMAIKSKFDFLGGYEHDTKGGILHIADHHISPGKKQWTWGNGDFGNAWYKNLTDKNGPYIELMAGVFTDNQPDFSWLHPYEERTFVQYFLPYHDLGKVKNATINAAVNLEKDGDKVKFGVYVTSEINNASVKIYCGGRLMYEKCAKITPYKIFWDEIKTKCEKHELKIEVCDSNGNVIISYQPEKESLRPVPEPAKSAAEPEEIQSIEQLYLTGLHLEQYRHATYEPTKYYLEALKRDPDDIRNNNAMGLWFLKRGKFTVAEEYFKKAIATITERNSNPPDGELFFNLGIALEYQGKDDEAFEAFYKAAWNYAWQAASYFHLARLALKVRNYERAEFFIDKALVNNNHNNKALHLKVIILRKKLEFDKALETADHALEIDLFNAGVIYEKYLILNEINKENALTYLIRLKEILRNYVHNYIEYSLDYYWAGLYNEAVQLLKFHKEHSENKYPMLSYLIGYYYLLSGNSQDAATFFKEGENARPDGCFPNRLEEIIVLQKVLEKNMSDAKAWYYLGNIWYDKKQYEDAIICWENSVKNDSQFPTVKRNLALAYYNKKNNVAKAVENLESAFNLDKTDARVLMELDQLYKRINKPIEKRLFFLEQYLDLVNERDDLYLERVTMYNILGKFETAADLLSLRKFHPWEGGEGKVVEQYKISKIGMAEIAITAGECRKALYLLKDCEKYPENLGEGKLFGTRENDIHFLMGVCYEVLGEIKLAHEYFEKGTLGESQPAAAVYYNDQNPDKAFYQGLSFLKLGMPKKARGIFHRLIDYGEKHIFDNVKIDYFAVSLPDMLIFEDDLKSKNEIHCKYLIGLGKLGLDVIDEAISKFDEIISIDNSHQGAIIHKRLAEADFFRLCFKTNIQNLFIEN